MPISFDSLPQDKPVGALLPKGCYQARIIEATMRTPQNGGDDYLALTYTLKTIEGEDKGKLWDNFFDVDKPIPRYKLQRLLTALGLTALTTFELKDLTKVVVGKTVGTNVEVISGLKEGTEVVTTGQINLTNGTKVKVVK